jgi:hypothetical protein
LPAVVHRHAIHQQDPLVAVDDLREVALGHGLAQAALRQRLQDHVEVGLAGLCPEDRAPAHAVERLEHRLAVLRHEGLELGGVPADQRRRAALREEQGRELLVVVPQALGVVHHRRPGPLGQAQDLGVVDVLLVDGRVLAHQHDVPGVQFHL